jgi:hypothetical protein
MSPPILSLPVPMIEPSFGTLLVPAIGAAALTDPCLLAAGQTAIALPAITGRTEEKQRAAFAAQTKPLSQHHFARSRHGCSQAALDNSNRFVAG